MDYKNNLPDKLQSILEEPSNGSNTIAYPPAVLSIIIGLSFSSEPNIYA